MPSARATRSKTGKARLSNTANSSEDDELATEEVGPPLKKKRTSKKPSTRDPLNFNQFPPDMQKQLMKQALKAMAHAKDADADAGIVSLSFFQSVFMSQGLTLLSRNPTDQRRAFG